MNTKQYIACLNAESPEHSMVVGTFTASNVALAFDAAINAITRGRLRGCQQFADFKAGHGKLAIYCHDTNSNINMPIRGWSNLLKSRYPGFWSPRRHMYEAT